MDKVVSLLESVIASIGEFAADAQGEWDGVALEHLPVRLMPYRELEEQMEALGDEIARYSQPPTPAPAPETMSDILYDAAAHKEVIAVSKAEWDTTQERVGNAINALYDVLKLIDRNAPFGLAITDVEAIEAICKDALSRDNDFEVALGA